MISRYTKQALLVLMSIVGALIFFFTQLPSHDTTINFSVEPGFYDEEIELKILGSNGKKIYYTLDGSNPTTNDFLYTDGDIIMLSDATLNENNYSTRTDTTTSFRTDLVEMYCGGTPGYTVPNYNVDKCNIIKASILTDDGTLSSPIEAVYFINFQNKSAYKDIYIVSLVSDPINLFDYDTGIYVTGRNFDDYIDNELGTDDHTPHWWWWKSNYSTRGFESERPATVNIFDENRNEILSTKCGIRIQGGGSRGFLPRSLGCFSRIEYNGNDEFPVALFNEDMLPHKFGIFSGGDDNVFKLKDYFVHSMEHELAFATMDFIPCALFLNGEYWGTYYLTEKYNADYINDHYKVAQDNVIILKGGKLTEGNPNEELLFSEMSEFISQNDMTIQSNYEQACKLIDIDSYIDYYAAQIYIGRCGDWPIANNAAWRTRNQENSIYGDCRWRWMLYDVNSGGININQVNDDTLKNVLEDDSTFASLFHNDEFRLKFVKRLLYIGQNIYTKEACEKTLSTYTNTMKEPLMHSNMRFYNNTKAEHFDKNVLDIANFFNQRYESVWNFVLANIGEDWLEEHKIQK